MMKQFYFDCVESRKDDLKLGRVKVRIAGIHNKDISVLSTDDLPWATVMQPVTSAAISGVGTSPSLVEGSWVICMFMDDDLQVPIVMGSIAGIPTKDTADTGENVLPAPPSTPLEREAAGITVSAGDPYLGTMTEVQYDAFIAAIKFKESTNNYSAVNQLGYIGAYQFGCAALEDLGYIKKGTWAAQRKNSAMDSADV